MGRAGSSGETLSPDSWSPHTLQLEGLGGFQSWEELLVFKTLSPKSMNPNKPETLTP